MKRSHALLSIFIHNAHHLELLLSILMFALGTGVAQYLGKPVNWVVYLLGQAWVLLILISCYFFKVYYDRLDSPSGQANTQRDNRDDCLPAEVEHKALLQAGLTTLCIAAVITVLLYSEHVITPLTMLFLCLIIVMAFSYAMPPLRLAHSGYGELLTSILIANIIPALALILQTKEFHPMLGTLTFPFTALLLATAIARTLPTYAHDTRCLRYTLLTRLGWQRGMSFHNILIIAAYFLLGLAILQGLPWKLVSTGFLTLPIGAFQIWLMMQIGSGSKPRWKLLSLTSLALVILTIYFITFSLWTE